MLEPSPVFHFNESKFKIELNKLHKQLVVVKNKQKQLLSSFGKLP